MIRCLLDSSALWRILRDAALRAAWAEVVSVLVAAGPERLLASAAGTFVRAAPETSTGT